jgi:hypothetical protein
MGRAEQYRYLEATVRTRAWNEISPAIRAGWMNLAEAYGRLAEQAEEASAAENTTTQRLPGDVTRNLGLDHGPMALK